MENYGRRKNKKLIVSADDFGLTRGVNEAIVLAYRKGIVTSASLMVNGSAFEPAAVLAGENPGLDVGLHLDLTNDPVKLAVQSIRGNVRDSDLEREVRAQLEKAINAGVHLTHIDGHKHVHVIPQVLRVLCRVAPDYGIKAVRSVVERTPGLARLLRRNRRARRHILKQYVFGKIASTVWKLSSPNSWRQEKTGSDPSRETGRRFHNATHASDRGQTPFPPVCSPEFICPNRFYGITQTGFLDYAALTDVIRDLRGGINELMCHPGHVDDELKTTPTRLLSQRERELELLTRREVRDLIEQSGVELINYKNLVEDYGSCNADVVLRRYSAL